MIRRVVQALAVAAVISSFAVALLVAPRALRIPVATVYVLGLPGYFVTLALFPRSALDRVRRLLLSLALSVAVAVLVTLVVDLTVGLRARSWVGALAVVDYTAYLFSLREPSPSAPASWFIRPRIRLRDALLFMIAFVIFGAGVVLARRPLPASHVQGYTALWIVPAPGGSAVRVGLRSGELRPIPYRLVVYLGQQRLVESVLPPVAPGTRVERLVALPRVRVSARVVADLYEIGHPERPYRRVSLRLPASR